MHCLCIYARTQGFIYAFVPHICIRVAECPDMYFSSTEQSIFKIFSYSDLILRCLLKGGFVLIDFSKLLHSNLLPKKRGYIVGTHCLPLKIT